MRGPETYADLSLTRRRECERRLCNAPRKRRLAEKLPNDVLLRRLKEHKSSGC
jgi:hypothetical protein